MIYLKARMVEIVIVIYARNALLGLVFYVKGVFSFMAC
jgi:hypothetical protein